MLALLARAFVYYSHGGSPNTSLSDKDESSAFLYIIYGVKPRDDQALETKFAVK